MSLDRRWHRRFCFDLFVDNAAKWSNQASQADPRQGLMADIYAFKVFARGRYGGNTISSFRPLTLCEHREKLGLATGPDRRHNSPMETTMSARSFRIAVADAAANTAVSAGAITQRDID